VGIGREEARADILKEVADVICYADLLCSEMNANTGEVVMNKFDEVSKRMGYERQ
jgi:NTP pyrophosphatase (non-canonical NTP hydrolase)